MAGQDTEIPFRAGHDDHADVLGHQQFLGRDQLDRPYRPWFLQRGPDRVRQFGYANWPDQAASAAIFLAFSMTSSMPPTIERCFRQIVPTGNDLLAADGLFEADELTRRAGEDLGNWNG